MAQSSHNPNTLLKFITHLHAASARTLNKLHQTSGRKVWYQYWDTKITFQRSYLTRLNYIMQNPIKHKVATQIEQIWSSANLFDQNVTKAYKNIVTSLNIDDVNVIDDFNLF